MDQEYRELMEFLGSDGMVEGLVAGKEWAPALLPIIQEYRQVEGRTLFAHIEEYGSLVDTIVSTLGLEHVALHTASPVAYEVFSRLYPHVPLFKEWPQDQSFDHIVVAAAGVFQACDDIVEDVANGLGALSQYGTSHLFLPMTMVQAQYGVNNMVLQFLLAQDRMEAIREWAPLNVLEFQLGPAEVKKTRIAIREIEGECYRETAFIKLPHGVFGDMPVFSPVNYGLSLHSILLPGDKQSPCLGQDGIYAHDGRLPAPIRASLEGDDTYYLSFSRTLVDHRLENLEGNQVSGGRPSFEVITSLSLGQPQGDTYWIFPDKELAYMWYAYFATGSGQIILSKLASMAVTDVGFGQLLGSCRRAVLTVDQEAHLVEVIDQALRNFRKSGGDEAFIELCKVAEMEGNLVMP